MRKTRRALSLVIAAMMIISMLVVGTVAASAAGSYTVNGTAYTSLSTAMQKGNYITLNADSTENYVYCNMSTKKSVTIDLNENTLSFPAPANGRNTYFTTGTYGTSITFINGTVDFQYSAALDGTACINVGKDGSVIIGEGATIKAHDTNALIFVGSDSNIVVDGGSVQAEDSFAIVANGSQGSNGSHNYTINVKSGSVSTNGDCPAIYHCNDGALNISGGSITGRPAVYVKSGDTTITGGTLNGVGVDTDYSYNGNGANPTGDALVVDNCGYPGGEPNVTVTGGTFNSASGEAVAAYSSQGEDPIEDFVAGGTLNGAQPVNQDVLSPAGSYDANTGVVTIVKPFAAGDQAFDDFTDALAFVADGGTIKVLTDAMLNDANDVAHDVIAKNVTIDLCGNTLTTAPRNSATAGSKNDTRYDFVVKDGATVTVKNGKVDSYNGYFGFLVEDGTVNIASDAVYEGFNETTVLFVKPTGTLNVDGTVITHDYFAIGVNGAQSPDYTININDGAVVTADGDADCAIYQCGGGTLNVKSGSTITGPTGIMAKSGTTNITGGTITATGAKNAFAHNNNGPSNTGDALCVENCSYPNGKVNVNVTGGTFTSANGEAVASYAEDAYVPVNNFISGGTFSGDVSEYAKNGSYMKYNAATDTTSYSYYSNNPNKLQSKKYVIDAYQNKTDKTGESIGDEGNDINTKGVRIITKFTNDINASEYGYIVGKYSGNKAVDQMDFSRLNTNNGAKKIDCTGSENNIDGLGAGYVTLAVNGMEAGDKVVARFYAVINGVTYYSNYVSAFGNVNGGILAEMI